VANCDNIVTVSKNALAKRRGNLNLSKVKLLNEALKVALELDQ